jgi:hypothetical protein
MTSTTRANVVRLIALRADVARIGISDETSRSLCRKIIASDELDALRDELLDMLGRAAADLHTERGRLALWHAIAAIPPDESRPVEQRQAAKLILWHNMSRTARARYASTDRWAMDDEALDGMGVDEFNETITLINAFDRARETLIAIADVWLRLLPELTTADVDWLETLVPAEQNERKTS